MAQSTREKSSQHAVTYVTRAACAKPDAGRCACEDTHEMLAPLTEAAWPALAAAFVRSLSALGHDFGVHDLLGAARGLDDDVKVLLCDKEVADALRELHSTGRLGGHRIRKL